MPHLPNPSDRIDLGSATLDTRGAVPGPMPDGIQPMCYPTFGLSAD